jgi:hypothetical protein
MAFLNQAGRIAGNTVNAVVENVRGASATIGRAALHSLAPDNFEYYMCSLELLDSSGNTKGFMTFVIMPNNIMETKTQIVSITKTNRGISTLFNSTFVPRDISIQGTFGRKLRLLAGMKETENISKVPFFGGNAGFSFLKNDVLIKTGYGLTKMLKSMIDKSYELDANKNPCILIFNNYALNTHYVVEVMQSAFSQSVENNMLWYYNLEMKAVAPASAVKRQNQNSDKTFFGAVASNAIAKGIGGLLNDVSRTLGGLPVISGTLNSF